LWDVECEVTDGIKLDFGPVAGLLNMMMTLQAPDQVYNSVLICGRCRIYCYFLAFCCWYQCVVFVIRLIFPSLPLMPEVCATSWDSTTLSQMWHRKKTWVSYCLDILGTNNMRYSEVHIVTKFFNLAFVSKYFFLNHMCYSHMIHMLMLNSVLVLLL
jgi:hypothetical protein